MRDQVGRRVWFCIAILAIGVSLLGTLAACSPALPGVSGSTSAQVGNGALGWPFDAHAGSWVIENGYNWNSSNGGLDHGCSSYGQTCYEQDSFDFQIRGPQGSTVGAQVLSPVSGSLVDFKSAVPGDGSSGYCVSIGVKGYPGYHVLICHLRNEVSDRTVTRGDVIGQVAGGDYGDHIHMTLYYLNPSDGNDTVPNASKRKAVPFTIPWAIGGCMYTPSGKVNEWAGTAVPCSNSGGASGSGPTPTPTASSPSTVYAIGDKGTLDALNPTTGDVTWSVQVGGQPSAGLPSDYLAAVSDNILFVTAAQSDPSIPNLPGVGHLTAVDILTHQILWTTHKTVIYLAELDDRVYVSDSTGIAALDAHNDKLLWHYNEPQPYPLGFGLYNGVAYLSYLQDATHGYLDAIKLGDGSRLWRSALPGLALDSLAVANGIIYTTARGNQFKQWLTAFATTGQRLWSVEDDGTSLDIQTGNGLVYAHTVGSDPSGTVLVLDAQTGQVNAGFGSHLQGCELGSPLLAGGVLYVGCSSLSTSSTVTAYGAESGAQIWEKAVNGSYVFPLGQQGNVVYVLGQYDGNANGTTTALKTSDGSILWQHTGSYITATGGVALISSGNILSALDAASGRTLWQATELGANIQALAA